MVMRPSWFFVAAAVLARAAAQLSLDDDQQDDDETQPRVSRGSASLRGSHLASQEDADGAEEGNVLTSALSEMIKHEADAEQAKRASENQRRRCQDIEEKVHDLQERLRSAEMSEHKLRDQVELTERADDATREMCEKKISSVKKHTSQKLRQYQHDHRACRVQRRRLNQTLTANIEDLAKETHRREHAESLVQNLTAKLSSAIKVLKREEAELHLEQKKAALEGRMFHMVKAKLRQENATEVKLQSEAQRAEAALADVHILLSSLQKQEARESTQAHQDMGNMRAALSKEQGLRQAAEQNASSLATALANMSRTHAQLQRKLAAAEYALGTANSDRASMTNKLTKAVETEKHQASEMVQEKSHEQQLTKARDEEERLYKVVTAELGDKSREGLKTRTELDRVSEELSVARKQIAAQEARLALTQKRLEAALEEVNSTKAENMDLNTALHLLKAQVAQDLQRDRAKMKAEEMEEGKLRTEVAQAKQDLTTASKDFEAQAEVAKSLQLQDTKRLTEDGRQLGRLARGLAALNKTHVEEKARLQSQLGTASKDLTTLRQKLHNIQLEEVKKLQHDKQLEEVKELQHDKELIALRQQLHTELAKEQTAMVKEKKLEKGFWEAVDRAQEEEKVGKKQLQEAQTSIKLKEQELKRVSFDQQKLKAKLLEAQEVRMATDKKVMSLSKEDDNLQHKLHEAEGELTMSKTEVDLLQNEKAGALKAASTAEEKLEAEVRRSNSQTEKLVDEQAELTKLRGDFGRVSAVAEKQAQELRKFEHFDENLRKELGSVAAMESKQAKEVVHLREVVAKAAELPTELRKKKETTHAGKPSAAKSTPPANSKSKVSRQGVPHVVPPKPPMRKADAAFAEQMVNREKVLIEGFGGSEHATPAGEDDAENNAAENDDAENDDLSEADHSADDAPAAIAESDDEA